jgi:Protein of unknown function (DUF3619)
MNQPASIASRLELLESRFALRIASRLTQASDTVSADVGERLRFARERALERARALRAATADGPVAVSADTLALGGPPSGWFKLAALLPLVALVVGLLLINEWHSRQQVSAAAAIDADLLADDLPPGAYSDPGFVEFLKTPPRE